MFMCILIIVMGVPQLSKQMEIEDKGEKELPYYEIDVNKSDPTGS